MKGVFFDSSVLIAACLSRTGASAALLAFCKREKVAGYVSRRVILETRKNLTTAPQDVKHRLNVYLLQHKLSVSLDAPEQVTQSLATHMHPKDAPILAAAMHSPAKYLVTLDYGDFLHPQVRRLAPALTILSPGDFLKEVAER